MTETGYGSPEDLEARKRLGTAIKVAIESQGLDEQIISLQSGASVLDIHLLISGSYERAWDFPQRHEVQQALHWGTGSWERVLQGIEEHPAQFL